MLVLKYIKIKSNYKLMSKSINLGDSTTRLYNRYKYMVTVAKNQKRDKVLLDEIHSVLHYITQCYPTIEFKETVYEIAKYNQLHSHSIVFINKKIRYASISKYNDFRIYWRPIFDLKGARSYLTKVVKNQKIQKQILNRNLLL